MEKVDIANQRDRLNSHMKSVHYNSRGCAKVRSIKLRLIDSKAENHHTKVCCEAACSHFVDTHRRLNETRSLCALHDQ
jgi:hypothetical protein